MGTYNFGIMKRLYVTLCLLLFVINIFPQRIGVGVSVPIVRNPLTSAATDSAKLFTIIGVPYDSVRMQVTGFNYFAYQYIVMYDRDDFPSDTNDGVELYNFFFADTALYNDTTAFFDVGGDSVFYFKLFSFVGTARFYNQDTAYVNDTPVVDSAAFFSVSGVLYDSVRMQVIGFDPTGDRFVGIFARDAWPSDTTDGTKKFAFMLADTALYNDTTTFVDVGGDSTLFWRLFTFNAGGSAYNQDSCFVNNNEAPVASAVSITGSTYIDSTLTIAYTYSDDESDAEGTSTFKWFSNGAETDSTRQSYVLSSADSSYYVYGQVTPVAATGASPGVAVDADSVGPITHTPYSFYAATSTFRLGNTGITIAKIDTVGSDTLIVTITGSPQPTADTLPYVYADSLQVGGGAVFDSINLEGGEIVWYAGSEGFNISRVVYSEPDTADVLTLSAPDNDSLGFEVTGFDPWTDSVYVRWDTTSVGWPTSITDGNLAHYGDTTDVFDTIFIDMASDDTVFVSVFSGNGGAYASTTWSTLYNKFAIVVDSTGEGGAFAYLSEFYSDTIRDRWASPPTAETTYDLIFDTLFYALDTITDGGAVVSVLRKAEIQYLLACHDATDALINTAIQGGLTGNFPLTEVGAGELTFTQYNGFEGDGTNYFTTGWDPTNNAINYSQNSAAVAIMTNDDEAAADNWEMGADNGSNDMGIYVQRAGPATGGKVNGSSGVDYGSNNSGDIFLVLNRGAGNDNLHVWIDGSDVAAGGGGTDGLPATDFFVFAYNLGGNPYGISENEISYIWVGGLLTATQIANWDKVMDWFKLRMGY